MDQPTSQKKLRTFGPTDRLDKSGFLCIRQGDYVYPPFYDLRAIEALKNTWDTSPNDIFVTTHQKVGTHLTKKYTVEILRAMVSYPASNPLTDGDIGHHAVPWPEVMVSQYGLESFHQFLADTEGLPRVWYLHSYSRTLPFRSIHPESKFIYTIRDPRGAAVSQYFFYRGHPNLEVDSQLNMHDFITLFIKGKLYFGDYHQHVLDWLSGCHSQIAEKQLLILQYEELVTNKLASTSAIANFIQPGAQLSDSTVNAVAKTTDFATMKQGLIDKPGSFHFNPVTFFRAGTTNDWQLHLSTEAQALIDQKTRDCWGKSELNCLSRYITNHT
jgi:hypothetical protein